MSWTGEDVVVRHRQHLAGFGIQHHRRRVLGAGCVLGQLNLLLDVELDVVVGTVAGRTVHRVMTVAVAAGDHHPVGAAVAELPGIGAGQQIPSSPPGRADRGRPVVPPTIFAASDPPGYWRMSWRSDPTSGNFFEIAAATAGSTARARYRDVAARLLQGYAAASRLLFSATAAGRYRQALDPDRARTIAPAARQVAHAAPAGTSARRAWS